MLVLPIPAGLLACLWRSAFPRAYDGVQWLEEHLTY